MSFPSSSQKSRSFLHGGEISVLLLQAPLDLPELLHYAGLMPIRPQVPRLIIVGKDSDAGRDWGQEEKGTTEDEMVGWHH